MGVVEVQDVKYTTGHAEVQQALITITAPQVLRWAGRGLWETEKAGAQVQPSSLQQAVEVRDEMECTAAAAVVLLTSFVLLLLLLRHC